MTSQETIENMNAITSQLYLGNATAAYDTETLANAGITHILTLDCNKIIFQPDQNAVFEYKFINCLDMPSYDMLGHFEECFQFIDEALKMSENKVLVHCFQGMSRSATVMIAYLMYTQHMCLDEAYGMVKEKRPCVRPNPGFIQQLEVFEGMGKAINKSHPVYKKYRLGIISSRAQKGDFELSEEDLGTVDNTESYYKCTKCRSSSIMKHAVGEGEAAFDWRSKVPASKKDLYTVPRDNSAVDCNKSIFIEPVKWMGDCIKQLEGKLNCPKCSSKLGSFIWYGEKCPCGAWVAPAFHIQSSKVDLVKPRPLPALNQSGGGHVTTTGTVLPISDKSCDTDKPMNQSDSSSSANTEHYETHGNTLEEELKLQCKVEDS